MEIAHDQEPRHVAVDRGLMAAWTLRASLFTSVVAFGVAVFVAAMGVVLMLLGWSLVRVSRAGALI